MRVSSHWHITSVNAANCGTIVLSGLATSQNTSQSGSLFNPDRGGRRSLSLPFWRALRQF